MVNTFKRNQVRAGIYTTCRVLEWISKDECFKFWQVHVKAHIAMDPNRIDLSKCPNGFIYVASYWTSGSGKKAILLEAYH